MAKEIDIKQVRDLPEKIQELEESVGAEPIPDADIEGLFTD